MRVFIVTNSFLIKKYEEKVTKSELISKIATKNPNLLQKDVERIVDVILETIVQTLAKGNRIEFRGFGSFSVRKRAPRVAKNPRTGNKMSITERNIPHFKIGKGLLEMLNK